MTKKQKITLTSVFAAIVIIFAAAAFILNYRTAQIGMKNFQIEVISDRDGYNKVEDWKSSEEYLGKFLRTYKGCEWYESDLGIYITGFEGMKEDMDNQYWWCITVNDQKVSLGADQIPVQNGDKYTFTLKQGW